MSPLKGQDSGQGPAPRSLRDVVYQIDNEKDFNQFIASHASKVGTKRPDIKYERHPVRPFRRELL